jgi:glutamate formiminotransferase/formiminotetrahydrofolate cyclodeaminase
MERIVECVPNFSEGRDEALIRQITDAVESVSGVTLLDVDPGADTNRTVVTFIGSPETIGEAAFRAVTTCGITTAPTLASAPRMSCPSFRCRG